MHRESSKGKQGAQSSTRKRQAQPDVPPLFCSDPEKNFSLWVQNCFPDTELAREDAIRLWLTSPLDSRVQKGRKNPAEIANSNVFQTPAGPSQQARNVVVSKKTDVPNLTGGMGWNPKLLAPRGERRFFAWSNLSKWLLRLGTVSVAGLLIGIVLRVTPIIKGISQAASSIEANEPSNAGPAPASGVPVQTVDKAIETGPDVPTAATTIEDLSVGCEDTQPCVQISTRGKASLPKVSTLTSPDRVIMDFSDAVLSPDIQGIEVGHGAVKDVRIGQKAVQPSRTRVVIDLTEKCNYELRTVTNGVVLKVSPEATPHQTGL